MRMVLVAVAVFGMTTPVALADEAGPRPLSEAELGRVSAGDASIVIPGLGPFFPGPGPILVVPGIGPIFLLPGVPIVFPPGLLNGDVEFSISIASDSGST